MACCLDTGRGDDGEIIDALALDSIGLSERVQSDYDTTGAAKLAWEGDRLQAVHVIVYADLTFGVVAP